MKRIVYVLIISAFLLAACQETEKEKTITVLAAASLKEPLEEMKQLYEEENDVQIQLQFGSSGKLAKQVKQGAEADIFISADEKWMDDLAENQLIQKESITPFVYNSLVLIELVDRKEAMKDIHMLTDSTVQQIAIGHPETVPAGRYAKQVLQKLNLWDNLEEKFVYTNDVRQALTYVQTGNVDAGIVYKTDALLFDDIDLVEELETSLHDEILYPIGMMTAAENELETETFYNWLLAEEANAIKESYEFEGI